MDTDHRSVPGEDFLDLPLDPPSDGEPDLGWQPDLEWPLHLEQEETSFFAAFDDIASSDDIAPRDDHSSAPAMIVGLEPASDAALELGGPLHDEQEDSNIFPAFDDVVMDEDDSSTPAVDDLFQLTEDVWGSDSSKSADPVPGPGIEEELAAGLAVTGARTDADADPVLAAVPALTEQASSRQTGRRSVRDAWAGMEPSRRQAIGIAGSALFAVSLVGAAYLQRGDVSEDVMSTGTVQTTTSVAARRTPPAPTSTAPQATETSVAAPTDPSGAPVPPTNDNPGAPAPSAPGGPASPRVTAAGSAPSAPGAPAPAAPAPANTTPVTRAVETPAAPATTAPPVVLETTDTTRRFREPPTTVELPTPTTVAVPENSGSVPCSPYIARGPLACPPAQ